MGNQEDNAFLKTFSAIIAGLVLFTFAIIFLANFIAPDPQEDRNPSRTVLAAERVAPVGRVRTDASAMPLAAVAPAAVAVDPASIDGGAIYANACQACHLTGAAGAPQPGSDAWAERAAQGLEVLAGHAINGFNAMPPKGGRLDLSDDEVIAAVEHMLSK
jgi:cytochrome c5